MNNKEIHKKHAAHTYHRGCLTMLAHMTLLMKQYCIPHWIDFDSCKRSERANHKIAILVLLYQDSLIQVLTPTSGRLSTTSLSDLEKWRGVELGLHFDSLLFELLLPLCNKDAARRIVKTVVGWENFKHASFPNYCNGKSNSRANRPFTKLELDLLYGLRDVEFVGNFSALRKFKGCCNFDLDNVSPSARDITTWMSPMPLLCRFLIKCGGFYFDSWFWCGLLFRDRIFNNFSIIRSRFESSIGDRTEMLYKDSQGGVVIPKQLRVVRRNLRRGPQKLRAPQKLLDAQPPAPTTPSTPPAPGENPTP